MRSFIATTASLVLLTASFALTTGCGGGTTVTRTEENAVIDLSGNWNAADSQQVADAMIADCITFPWADQFKAKYNRIPTVKVGRIVVETNGDVVNTTIFTDDLLRSLLRSGKAQPVASNNEKDQAREERKDQDVNASETTRKESFQETGADFLIIGKISVQDDQAGGKRQKYYATTLKMTDVKSNEQAWMYTKKISKLVTR